MKRRTLLQAAGIAGVSLVGAGAWRSHREGVFSVGEGPAYEPWRNWRAEEGPRRAVGDVVI
jgi:hypothetical protein